MALKINQCLSACPSGVPGTAHLHHPVSREPRQSHAFGLTEMEGKGHLCPKVTFLVWLAYRHGGSSHIFFLCLDCCHLGEIHGQKLRECLWLCPCRIVQGEWSPQPLPHSWKELLLGLRDSLEMEDFFKGNWKEHKKTQSSLLQASGEAMCQTSHNTFFCMVY